MDNKVRSMKAKADKRGRIRLPEAVLEESGMKNGQEAEIYYGKNYSCVIIIPTSITDMHPDMQKRIEYLVTDRLGK